MSPKILDFRMTDNHYIHRQGSPLVPLYPFLRKLTYAFYKAGVPLVTGTDSPIIPGCFPDYSLIKALELLTEAGIPATDALRTATLVPGRFTAKYLPHTPRTGVIKKDSEAELLRRSENPLQRVQNLRKIKGVMAKGRRYRKEQLAGPEKTGISPGRHLINRFLKSFSVNQVSRSTELRNIFLEFI